MTLSACGLRVRPGQREAGPVVIERGSLPLRRRVACGAVLREAGGRVIGIGRLLIIGQVAGNTGGGKAPVEARRMTLSACSLRVRAGQREAGPVVIERGPFPLRRGVARGAVLRKAGGRVIGTGRLLIIGQVAGRALSGSGGVCARRMALSACGLRVRAGQREAGPVVIERGSLPLRRRVACGAVLREAGGRVIGIGRLLIIGQVASRALGCGPGVCARRVALGAGRPECARRSARSGSGCDRTRLPSTASSCGTRCNPAESRRPRDWDWPSSYSRPGGKPSIGLRSRCIVRSRGTGSRRPERARRSTGTAPDCDRTSPLASSTCCGNWCNPSGICRRHGSDSSLPRNWRRGSRNSPHASPRTPRCGGRRCSRDARAPP